LGFTRSNSWLWTDK